MQHARVMIGLIRVCVRSEGRSDGVLFCPVSTANDNRVKRMYACDYHLHRA